MRQTNTVMDGPSRFARVAINDASGEVLAKAGLPQECRPLRTWFSLVDNVLVSESSVYADQEHGCYLTLRL
jgi:hypothetical protein